MTARRIAPDAQEAIATAKFIRMSPTKVRQVVDLIRGRHVDDARRVLTFTNRAATGPVKKVLDSAIANADHNGGLPVDELFVARAWVDEGPTLRRFRPRALGRATRIRKRTCHISVVVGRSEEILADLRSQEPVTKRRKTEDTENAPKKKTTRRSGAAQDEASETKGRKSTAKKTAAKKTTAKKTTARRSTKKETETGKEGES